jgi:hypothetical protein
MNSVELNSMANKFVVETLKISRNNGTVNAKSAANYFKNNKMVFEKLEQGDIFAAQAIKVRVSKLTTNKARQFWQNTSGLLEDIIKRNS